MNDGELATACLRMSQVHPSFSKASRAMKVFLFLVATLPKMKKIWTFLSGFVARFEPLVTFCRKTILSITRLETLPSQYNCIVKGMSSGITCTKVSKAFLFKPRVVSTQGQLGQLARQSSPRRQKKSMALQRPILEIWDVTDTSQLTLFLIKQIRTSEESLESC